MSENEPRDPRKLTAYILLAVAAYIVLANTGMFNILGIAPVLGWFFRTAVGLIPAAILFLGLFWLSRTRDEARPLAAWALTIFGIVLVISQTGLFGLSFGNMFLPMWLVIVAFFMMNPRNILPKRFNSQQEDLSDDDERINLLAFMGGGDLHYTTRDLNGGEIIAVWGGYQIDFSKAEMAGDSMELNMICVMGGCEIVVPAHWEVEKRGAVCIMGGFSNKTRCLAEELELPRKKLIINGLALMGGGEVRN